MSKKLISPILIPTSSASLNPRFKNNVNIHTFLRANDLLISLLLFEVAAVSSKFLDSERSKNLGSVFSFLGVSKPTVGLIFSARLIVHS